MNDKHTNQGWEERREERLEERWGGEVGRRGEEKRWEWRRGAGKSRRSHLCLSFCAREFKNELGLTGCWGSSAMRSAKT